MVGLGLEHLGVVWKRRKKDEKFGRKEAFLCPQKLQERANQNRNHFRVVDVLIG